MPCAICPAVRQYAFNALLLADLGLNTVLAGSPHESVSRRTARARKAGSKAAAVFCRVLTFCSNLLGNHGDHCDWALAEQTLEADEVWHWTGSEG